jgi:hypothetical protein
VHRQEKGSKLKILQRTIRRKRGKHCARIRFEDDKGTIHEIMRTADNKSAAKTRLAQLEVEILEKGTARLEAGKVTFRQLAEYVKTRIQIFQTGVLPVKGEISAMGQTICSG